MTEPIGWNVYDTTGAPLSERGTFREFIPNEKVLGPVSEKFADEVAASAAEAAAAGPVCGAVLFPLPSRVPAPGFPVHPWDVVYFAPQHGPAPLRCARDPHPDSPWHWRDGTWWR